MRHHDWKSVTSLSSFTSVCTVKILQNTTFSSQCSVVVNPGHCSDYTTGMGSVLSDQGTHSTETNLATEPLPWLLHAAQTQGSLDRNIPDFLPDMPSFLQRKQQALSE